MLSGADVAVCLSLPALLPVVASVGNAVLDAATAAFVYERAGESAGHGE